MMRNSSVSGIGLREALIFLSAVHERLSYLPFER